MIWSWSSMPCEKHGPRASVTTKTSAFGIGFCLLSPAGHVFHTAWETMIKSYNKWNQISSNNICHTSWIHKGLHAGKWPDLMTTKPEALSTLGYHLTDCTGTTLADAIAQWSYSGNPVLICIIGTHWKTTGATSTLECHWNHTGWC